MGLVAVVGVTAKLLEVPHDTEVIGKRGRNSLDLN